MSENTPQRSSVGLAGWLALHAACGFAILWLLLKLAPQFQKIFKDFGSKLPDITLMIIDLSLLLRSYWYVLIPGFGGGDIAIMVLLNRAAQTRLMIAWGILAWLAEMLLIGLIVQALFLPLITLVSPLSGGK